MILVYHPGTGTLIDADECVLLDSNENGIVSEFDVPDAEAATWYNIEMGTEVGSDQF